MISFLKWLQYLDTASQRLRSLKPSPVASADLYPIRLCRLPAPEADQLTPDKNPIRRFLPPLTALVATVSNHTREATSCNPSTASPPLGATLQRKKCRSPHCPDACSQQDPPTSNKRPTRRRQPTTLFSPPPSFLHPVSPPLAVPPPRFALRLTVRPERNHSRRPTCPHPHLANSLCALPAGQL